MVPSSKIYICAGVLLRSDQAHTIYFANETAQRNYFIGRAATNVGGRTFTDYTFTKDNVAYVEASFGTAEYWNYAMIENTVEAGPVMRKYYFIEDVEYVDENTVALHLKLDVMQTFQHQPAGGYIQALPSCFVEREHSVYDGSRAFAGSTYNTLEEPLDTGEFVVRDEDRIMATDYYLVVAATVPLHQVDWYTRMSFATSYSSFMNGLWSGLGYFVTDLIGTLPSSSGQYPATTAGVGVGLIMDFLNEKGMIDAVKDIFIMPKAAISVVQQDSMSIESPFVRVANTLTSFDNSSFYISIPSAIGNYTPRNKKLLQYPYCFPYVTDQKGLSAVYRFEYYNPAVSGKFYMTVSATATSDASIMIYPAGRYKGILNNVEEGILINNFPRTPWLTDQYLLWLAQTANTRKYNMEQINFSHTYKTEQLNLESVKAGMNLLGGAATALLTGGTMGLGSVFDAAGSIANIGLESWANDETYRLAKDAIRAQVKDHAVTPAQSKGGTSGMIEYVCNTIIPKMQLKTVDDMHARIIDEYFDHYGYATNTFKVPNINSRPSWNFVKTAGFDVKLAIPQRYKVAISEVFNNGITFWKNPAKIGDYTQNNAAQS